MNGISPGGTAQVLKDFLWTRGGLHRSAPVRCHFDSLPRICLDGKCDPSRGGGPLDTQRLREKLYVVSGGERVREGVGGVVGSETQMHPG